MSWKPCVKAFDVNASEEILRMSEELTNGTYKHGRPKPITIWYPKKREGLSIPFRDRIYQRSINDNVLYPLMTQSFIEENSACQIGKGSGHARKIVKRNLNREFINYGLDFYVLQIDIHHYYQSLPHDLVENMFREKLGEGKIFSEVQAILRMQNSDDKGYNPGSQMIQIAGISFLNNLDHYIKEQLHLRDYQRYMDDFLAFHHDKEYLESCLDIIVSKLKELGLEVNEKKTHVAKITDGFKFLGFEYRLLDTGKVIMTIPTDKVKHERRKLLREVILWSKGEMTKKKIYEGLNSWKSTHKDGNVQKVFMRLDSYLAGLFAEYAQARREHKQYEVQEKRRFCSG